jgi:hypothetical protein
MCDYFSIWPADGHTLAWYPLPLGFRRLRGRLFIGLGMLKSRQAAFNFVKSIFYGIVPTIINIRFVKMFS